jgi:iron complex transport system substrate-binding protein
VSYARRLAGGALAALLATTVLAACGSSEKDEAATGGPWSFTSGDGKKVTLDTTPTRIIASGPEAAALISFGIKPVGIYATGPVEKDPNLKDLDLSGITILGETWGEIDVEKAASLRPDLVVADYWPAEKTYSGMEEGVKSTSKRLLDLAPIVGISQGDSIEELADGYEDLAESLGADLDDPSVAADKEAFEAARAEFTKTVKTKDGLTALAVSPADDVLYVANPEYAPELLDLQRWGLDVIDPDQPDKGFPYWENLSWENADKYQPDLIMVDDRSASTMATATAQPTWTSIKAAAAGAVVDWPAFWMRSYSAYASELETLTTAINATDEHLSD